MTKDTMISVRLPTSMIQELKQLGQQNHYVDLSEYVRAILRKKCENCDETKTQTTSQETNTSTNNSINIADEKKKFLMLELERIVSELKK